MQEFKAPGVWKKIKDLIFRKLAVRQRGSSRGLRAAQQRGDGLQLQSLAGPLGWAVQPGFRQRGDARARSAQGRDPDSHKDMDLYVNVEITYERACNLLCCLFQR